MKTIAIVMGSASDLPVARKAGVVLEKLGIPFSVHVYSAHRTFDETASFSRGAEEAGFGVIIAFAGMAAHLAGAIAANTVLPVIGVPVAASLGAWTHCLPPFRCQAEYRSRPLRWTERRTPHIWPLRFSPWRIRISERSSKRNERK